MPADRLWSLVRAALFELDPERAHDLALRAMELPGARALTARRYGGAAPDDPGAATVPVRVMGLELPNRVGLAAGLDKDGAHVDALGALGFGHLEVGTVTPRPQPGNPGPRMFRLEAHGALINRMGFNNAGVDALVERVSRRRWRGVLGVNVGKNASTPNERATDDYVTCLERAWPVADYVAVNVSSPNTAGLRELQHGDALARLLDALCDARERLATRHGVRRPIAVKIAPDMDDAALDGFADAAVVRGIDAVIVGNTTRERRIVAGHLHAPEAGGLSGTPLRPLADDRLAAARARLPAGVALVGVGGVDSGAAAAAKIALGADLVQLYTGLIYRGPGLVRETVRATDDASPSPDARAAGSARDASAAPAVRPSTAAPHPTTASPGAPA